MVYYQLSGSDGMRSSYALPYMPNSASNKQRLIDQLERGFVKCMKDNVPIDFKWMSFFTGYSAGCGEVYVLTKPYALKIGYTGPVTFRAPMYIIVTDKHIHNDGNELVFVKRK